MFTVLEFKNNQTDNIRRVDLSSVLCYIVSGDSLEIVFENHEKWLIIQDEYNLNAEKFNLCLDYLNNSFIGLKSNDKRYLINKDKFLFVDFNDECVNFYTNLNDFFTIKDETNNVSAQLLNDSNIFNLFKISTSKNEVYKDVLVNTNKRATSDDNGDEIKIYINFPNEYIQFSRNEFVNIVQQSTLNLNFN